MSVVNDIKIAGIALLVGVLLWPTLKYVVWPIVECVGSVFFNWLCGVGFNSRNAHTMIRETLYGDRTRGGGSYYVKDLERRISIMETRDGDK